MIHILTLSNKPTYLPDAIASVERQTRRDFVHHVAVDGPEWGGADVYRPSVYFNRVAEAVPAEDYVCWLSDDDLLEPHFCEKLAGYLDAHPGIGCCYGGCSIVTYDQTAPPVHTGELRAYRTYDAGLDPMCQIDGGQIMVRRSVLDLIEQPWSPETMDNCNVADGFLLRKIANAVGIEPVVGSWVMVHRMTPLSAHQPLKVADVA